MRYQSKIADDDELYPAPDDSPVAPDSFVGPPAPTPAMLPPPSPRGTPLPPAPPGPGPTDLAKLRDSVLSFRADPDQELAAAQQGDRQQRGMDRASDALYAAFTRTAPRTTDYGDSQVAQLQQKRASQDQSLDRAMKVQGFQRAAADAAEQADPNSPTSKLAQSFIREKMKDVAAEIGPDLDRMSYGKILKVFPFVKEYLDTEAKKAALLPKPLPPEETALKKAQTDEAQARADALRNGKPLKPTDPLDEELKRARIDALRHPKEDARGAKLAYQQKQNTAYGFDPIDPQNPKALLPAQAQALADRATARDLMEDKITRALATYERNPHPTPGSNDLTSLRTIVSELMPQVAAVGNMQLTTGHQHLLESALSDPAEFANQVNSDRFPIQLKEILHSARASVNAYAKNLGQRPVSQGNAESPNQNTHAGNVNLDESPADPVVTVIDPQGRPRQVPKSKLAAALAKGGRLP